MARNNSPKLTHDDLGHIRHIGRLANQFPGDWSGMGADWWDVSEGAHQYELAFMTYLLGIVQNRFTPAYKDFCRETMEKLIGKMMLPDVWEKWILSSRGGKVVNPDQKELGPGWIDPIKKHNIMFKGHLLQMAALHEALYGTGKYAKPGAFTFEFRPTTWGNGDETFVYDLPTLAGIVHQEYVESDYEGVQCEPNRVFGMCNQHAILGLIHCDYAYGTSYATDVIPKFKEAWLRKGYTDPQTGSHMLGRLVQQEHIAHGRQPWADGWTGTFMHAWDRDFILEMYPRERQAHLESLLSGAEHERACCTMMTGAKIGFGMFTSLAAEVGDMEGRDALLQYAERNFKAVWQDGERIFPRNDDWKADERGNSQGIDVLTANALLPMARINTGDGLWDLYHLSERSTTIEPYFSRIDQEIAGVALARYDNVEQVLHLSLEPGPRSGEPLEFEIHGLDPERSYVLRRDQSEVGRLGGGSEEPAIRWGANGVANVRLAVGVPADYTLVIAA